MDRRLDDLKRILSDIGPCLVAFSGGVDSTFLLKVAFDVHGSEVTAVTAVSSSLAASERDEALALARFIGAPHRIVETREMDDPGYVANDGQRCYFCKRALFAALRGITEFAGGLPMLYGAIMDDLGDDRPGMRAAAEAGARAPLIEARLDKETIRLLSRQLGLPTWDKPAMACLASRVPRSMPVTAEALRKVERAEAAVRALGYRQVRVRIESEGSARIELDPADLTRAGQPQEREALIGAVHRAGFTRAGIDPRGYRPAGLAPPGPSRPSPSR